MPKRSTINVNINDVSPNTFADKAHESWSVKKSIEKKQGHRFASILGNNPNKPQPKFRNWCFTINNPIAQDLQEIQNLEAKYVVWQLEQGDNGTPHYQGTVMFKMQKMRGGVAKLLTRAHLEPTKDLKASIDYCQKQEGRLDGPWELGDRPRIGQGRRTDLQNIAARVVAGESIPKLIKENPEHFIKYHKGLEYIQTKTMKPRKHKTKQVVFFGKAGTGKSTCAGLFPKVHRMLTCNGQQQFFDGYDPCVHKTVVFDDFYGAMPYTEYLNINDEHAHNVHVKGSSLVYKPEWNVYTSNKEPDTWYPNMMKDPLKKGAFDRRLDVVIQFNSIKEIRVIKGKISELPLKVQEWLSAYHDINNVNDVLQSPPIIHTHVSKSRKSKKDKYKMSANGIKSFQALLNEVEQDPPLLTTEESSFSGGAPPSLIFGSHPRQDPYDYNATKPFRLEYEGEDQY